MKRLLGKATTYAVGRARPNYVGSSSSVDVLRMMEKGLGPGLRGALRTPMLGSSVFPLFVGRGVRILGKRHLFLGRGVSIGDFTYLDAYSQEGFHIADGVTLREGGWAQATSGLGSPGVGLWIGRDTYIGPRVYLGVGAAVMIGARCQIGGNVSIIAESHMFDGTADIFGQGVSREGVRIGEDCWIGNGVTVLDGVTIGDGCVIGAHSLVTTSLEPRTVAFGTPARPHSRRDA